MNNRAVVILQDLINKINNATPTPSVSDAQTALPSGSGWESFIQLIGLIILLALIIAATYFTTRLIGNVKQGQMKNSNFTLIDAYRVSPNKLLQIVKIGDKYVVLAVCKDTITYITELDEDSVTARNYQTNEKLSFSKLFEKVRNNK